MQLNKSCQPLHSHLPAHSLQQQLKAEWPTCALLLIPLMHLLLPPGTPLSAWLLWLPRMARSLAGCPLVQIPAGMCRRQREGEQQLPPPVTPWMAAPQHLCACNYPGNAGWLFSRQCARLHTHGCRLNCPWVWHSRTCTEVSVERLPVPSPLRCSIDGIWRRLKQPVPFQGGLTRQLQGCHVQFCRIMNWGTAACHAPQTCKLKTAMPSLRACNGKLGNSRGSRSCCVMKCPPIQPG